MSPQRPSTPHPHMMEYSLSDSNRPVLDSRWSSEDEWEKKEPKRFKVELNVCASSVTLVCWCHTRDKQDERADEEEVETGTKRLVALVFRQMVSRLRRMRS